MSPWGIGRSGLEDLAVQHLANERNAEVTHKNERARQGDADDAQFWALLELDPNSILVKFRAKA